MQWMINWVGGKQRQANELIPYMPADIKHYVEPFCGGCGILLKREPVFQEVINDIDGDLINFWTVVRDKHEELIQSFDYTLCSRQVFDEYKERYAAGNYESDVQRAHTFYYLNRAAFGSKMTGMTFGVNRGSIERNGLRMEAVEGAIRKAYRRLRNVVIEHLPFDEVMRRYDGRDTFFFLDPPYRGTIGYCGGTFTDDNYRELAELCRGLKGRFMLTINDDPFIRDLFRGFNIIERGVAYSVCRSQNGRSRRGELLIANYDIGDALQDPDAAMGGC